MVSGALVVSTFVVVSVALLSVVVKFKDIVVVVENGRVVALLMSVVVLATRSGKAREVESGTRRRESITIVASDSLLLLILFC